MSLHKNIAYNILLTFSQLLFPLLTFPYITRVLGPEKLGAVNFTQSYIGYFILFSILGISIYGQREIAINRNDIEKRSKVFCNILAVHISMTILMVVIYIATLLLFSRFNQYPTLFWLSIFHLVLNIFSIEWFFLGMEKFRYITIRTIIIRSLFVLAIFTLIKSESDFILYYSLTLLSTIIPFLININYANKQLIISMKWISFSSIKTTFIELKDMSYWFLLTSVYGLFPMIYLGFIQSNVAVGNFSVSEKLSKIAISVFTAISAVLLPKMSALHANGDNSHFKEIINKSLSLFIPISIFMSVVLGASAGDIVFLFAGSKFTSAGIALAILSPLIFFLPIAQIFILQALFPMKKERIVLKYSFISATVSISLNILLVSKFSVTGSAISMLIAEMTMTILSGYLSMKLLNLSFPLKLTISNILSSLLLIPIFLFIHYNIENYIIRLCVFFCFSILFFLFIQTIVFKDSDIKKILLQKINFKRLLQTYL